MYEMECGHRFCTTCWNAFLSNKIMNEGMGQQITCCGYDCRVLVSDEAVMSLLTDSSIKVKFQRVITNNFVEVKLLLVQLIASQYIIIYYKHNEKSLIFFVLSY